MRSIQPEVATTPASKARIWRTRFQLLKEGCLERNSDIRKRIIKQIFYKLFEPFFKEYYLYQTKQKASIIDWKDVYCGEKTGLVSVVLPVYNQAELLEESIESVLSQRYENFELIIVDDGSTDGVEKILDKYATHPKILIFTQGNQKLPAALSTGFANANGEFFTWTSADNIMLPNQLMEQVRFLRENDFIQMVYCNYELIDEQGRPFERLSTRSTNVVNTDQDVESLNYTYNFINACFLYRRYVATIIGNYDPYMYGAEDYDYWMRINDHFAIQHIGRKESYYKYRLHDNTILGREGEPAINDAITKAQQLDIQRKAFFELPITLYVPKDVPLDKRKKHRLPKELRLQLVAFESWNKLDSFLSNTPKNEKSLLFLTNREIKEMEYLSVMQRCKDKELLFTVGIVYGNIDNSEIEHLNLLDWIIVDNRGSYHSLSPVYKDKLLCVLNSYNCLSLCTIIANYHLFYRHIGRTISYPVPEHSIYKIEGNNSP